MLAGLTRLGNEKKSVVLWPVGNLLEEAIEGFLLGFCIVEISSEAFLNQLVVLSDFVLVGKRQGIDHFTTLVFPLHKRLTAADIVQIDPTAPFYFTGSSIQCSSQALDRKRLPAHGMLHQTNDQQGDKANQEVGPDVFLGADKDRACLKIRDRKSTRLNSSH